MGVISVILLVIFIIAAILLILIVLVQNEDGGGLGGMFGGGSATAFGSRSGNVLTRATTVLGVLFLTISFGMALLNRSPGIDGVEAAGLEMAPPGAGAGWLEDELNPAVVPPVLLPPVLDADLFQPFGLDDADALEAADEIPDEIEAEDTP
ncbi:MAG: preprotein translocase subunit SecG [Spirochaetes bacterium]|nr:preprotein translocase subunit SecG [Spirochaetota bacterium]